MSRNLVSFFFLCITTIFSGQKLHFKNFTLQDGLAQSQVYALTQDHNGLLWVGTQGGGVNVFDGQEILTLDKSSGLENLYINALVSTKQLMYVGTDKGLFTFKSYASKPSKSFDTKSIKVLHAVEDLVYVGTEAGLYEAKSKKKLHNGNFNFISTIKGVTFAAADHFVLKIRDRKIIGKIALKQVRYVYAKGDDFIGVTYAQGSYVLSTQEKVSEHIQLNGALCGTQVNDSTHWVGTLRNGIVILSNDSIIGQIKKQNGLASNSIRSLYRDDVNQLWIGTSGKGLQKYLPDGMKSVTGNEFSGIHSLYATDEKIYLAPYEGNILLLEGEQTKQIDLKGKKVRCFVPRNDTLFVGTDGAGIYALVGDKAIQYAFDKTIKWSRTLLVDSTVWIGTLGHGIVNSRREIPRQPFRRVNDLVNYKAELIIAADNGVYRFGQKFIKISDVPARSLAVLGEKVYIGSKTEGIFVWNGQDLSKFSLSWSDNIYFVRTSAERNLWIGTEKGVQKIHWEGGEPQSAFLGNNIGLLGIETCTNSFCEVEKGVWVGTIDGAVYIPNDYQATLNNQVNLLLESVNVNGTTQSDFSDLSSDENDIEIVTRGVNIHQQGQLYYRWRLNQGDWRKSGNIVALSALRPGHYDFEIQVSADQTHWGESLSLNFLIHQPFYFQWWFVILVLVIALVVGYSYLKRYKAQLKAKAERNQLFAELKDLEMKTLRLQLNPHFLFNCLNSIKGFIADDQPKEARRQITNFSKLMRTYLDYSSQKWISVSEEIAMLEQYVTLEQMLKSNMIELNVNFDQELSDVEIPTMLLQPFVENSIKHGFASKDGSIKIEFALQEKVMCCSIEDDGVGYSPQKKQTEHQSRALSIITERLELLSNIHHTDFSFSISDTGNGTKVEIKMPIR